jgi:hypothetical protein
MKTTNFIPVAILMSALISCNNKESTRASDESMQDSIAVATVASTVFDKLSGTWLNIDGQNFERWNRSSDNNYHMVVFSVKVGDTIWRERATLYIDQGKWVFENTVTGQNEGKTVRFTAIFINDNNVQFSNPAHDFPTDIYYAVPNDSTINAFIVGPNQQGGKDTIPFNYKRVH